MSSLNFGFEFYPIKKEGSSALAFFAARLYAGKMPLIRLGDGKVIQGKNGVFFAPASRQMVGKKDEQTGKDAYIDIWGIAPKPREGEEDNQAFRESFEQAIAAAWERFSGEVQAPRPQPAKPAAKATQKLPQGWQQFQDEEGRTYYKTPEGNVQWEGPENAAPPAPPAPPSKPAAPPAPAKAGAGKANAPFTGFNLDLEPPKPSR